MTWMLVVRMTVKVILESRKERRRGERKEEKGGTYILISTVVVAWIRVRRKIREGKSER